MAINVTATSLVQPTVTAHIRFEFTLKIVPLNKLILSSSDRRSHPGSICADRDCVWQLTSTCRLSMGGGGGGGGNRVWLQHKHYIVTCYLCS